MGQAVKIDRLELIFKALGTKEIIIAGAVLHKVEQAPFCVCLYNQKITTWPDVADEVPIRSVGFSFAE